MKKTLVLIIMVSISISLFPFLSGCGSKDVSGKYVSSEGIMLELTPEGKAYWSITGLTEPLEVKEIYKVEGNTVKTYEKGKEKEATILEIRNEGLVETKNNIRLVKQDKSSEGLNLEVEESNITQAQKRTCQANLRTITGAIAGYYAETGKYPTSLQELVDSTYIKTIPECPSGSLPYELRGDPPEPYCPNDPSHTIY